MFLILTYCSGYVYDIYKRFVGSLFDTTFIGKIVFFIQTKDIQKLDKLKEEFNDIKYPNTKIEYVVKDEIPFHIQTYRFFMYHKYLKENEQTANTYIMMCDSRDVLFQKDLMEIEKYENKYELYIFAENNIIKNNKHNNKWISIIANNLKEDLTNVRNEQIICSGLTIGTYNGMLKYLDVFITQVERLKNNYKKIKGLDQGIHNYLIYTKK